jgi:hypothetical protein
MFDERRIRKHGLTATATVVSMNEHSALSSNSYRRYDYVLDVQPTAEAPFRIEMRHTFAIMESKPQAYDVLNVKFDAKTHETIFDFTGDPRYDLDAMRARTDQMRKETAEMRAGLAARGITPGTPMMVFPGGLAGAGAVPTPTTAVDAIEKLVQLRDSGALTQQEFETLKSKLIGPT